MNEKKFEELVSKVVDNLAYEATQEKSKFKNASPEEFEAFVKDAIEALKASLSLDFKVIYEKGSHIFPDIIVKFNDNQKYGIEVKSTKSKQWKINGNSILGSTKDKTVISIFVVFGQLNNNPKFAYRKYEDCISDIVVTHSPRYKIDMKLDKEHNFFNQTGISYEELCKSNDPIGIVTESFRQQGKTAWWIAESSPATIELFVDLNKNIRDILIAECFIRFPEIFSKNNQQKYTRAAKWMIVTHSVIAPNLRDYFSASGQTDIQLNGIVYKSIPQVFNRLKNTKKQILDIIKDISSHDLSEAWKIKEDVIPSKPQDRLHLWISIIMNQICEETQQIFDIATFLNDLFFEK